MNERRNANEYRTDERNRISNITRSSLYAALQMRVQGSLGRTNGNLLAVCEDSRLDGRAVRHRFLRRDVAVGLAAEKLRSKGGRARAQERASGAMQEGCLRRRAVCAGEPPPASGSVSELHAEIA